jgi:hypothetical protein
MDFDMYLSCDWAATNDRSRVEELHDQLQGRRTTSWLDTKQLNTGADIAEEMGTCVDKSNFVVVFITRKYIEKVQGDDANDACKQEFLHADNSKAVSKMIPIVMDEEMKDTSKWTGPIGMSLTNATYIDFTPGMAAEKVANMLCSRTRDDKPLKAKPIAPSKKPKAAKPKSGYGDGKTLKENAKYIREQMTYPAELHTHEIISRAAMSLGIKLNDSTPM